MFVLSALLFLLGGCQFRSGVVPPRLLFQKRAPALAAAGNGCKVAALHRSPVVAFANADKLFFGVIAIVCPFSLGILAADNLFNGTAEIFVLIQPAGSALILSKPASFPGRAGAAAGAAESQPLPRSKRASEYFFIFQFPFSADLTSITFSETRNVVALRSDPESSGMTLTGWLE